MRSSSNNSVSRPPSADRDNGTTRVHFASKSAVLAIAAAGTLLAFILGAHAGALLNGRVMSQSVGHVPYPVMGSPGASPVHTHVR